MLNINFFEPQGPFNLKELSNNVTQSSNIKIFDMRISNQIIINES